MNRDTETVIFQALSIFEIVMNIIFYFIGSLCFYVVIKYPVFHTNFIRLIKCILVYYFGAQFTRLVIVFYESVKEEKIGNFNS